MITLHSSHSPSLLGITADSVDTPRLKRVPGARYNVHDGWTVPATPASIWVLAALFRPEEVRRDNGVEPVLEEIKSRYDLLMLTRRGQYSLPLLPEGLYDFQKTGSTFLFHSKRALLADEMGTGKTIQVLAILEAPALIVCPNSVKYNWARECTKWRPDLAPFVVDGAAGKRRKQIEAAQVEGAVVIINYESLKLHTSWKSPTNFSVPENRKQPAELNDFDWETVVLDEAHRIKDPKSQQTMAAHGVATGCARRYALTGTPILNHEGDLWPLLKWVDPDAFPDKRRFHDRYLLERPGWFGGIEVTGLNPAHEKEFHHVLETTMLRRTKAEVLPQLPPKTHTRHDSELQPKQRKAYDTFYKDLILRLESGVIAGRSLGEELARLRQLACGMPVLDDEAAVVGLETPSCKVDSVLELLEDTGDDPLVVYTDHRKILELLVSELRKRNITTGYISGAVPAPERQGVIDAFDKGDARVFAATCAAAGEGISLTRSSRLCFAQLPWSQGQYLQAQDRVHRLGSEQHSHIELISLISPDTIEERVFEVLQDKAASLEAVTRDAQRLLEFIT